MCKKYIMTDLIHSESLLISFYSRHKSNFTGENKNDFNSTKCQMRWFSHKNPSLSTLKLVFENPLGKTEITIIAAYEQHYPNAKDKTWSTNL